VRHLDALGVRISMGGKGRWLDNVVVERFWRSTKYESLCLWEIQDGRELERRVSGIGLPKKYALRFRLLDGTPPEREEDQRVKRLPDEIYLADPRLGSRRLVTALARDHELGTIEHDGHGSVPARLGAGTGLRRRRSGNLQHRSRLSNPPFSSITQTLSFHH